MPLWKVGDFRVVGNCMHALTNHRVLKEAEVSQPVKSLSSGHALDTPNGCPPILIIGYARSGTSWLGKIFDSHPDVMYLHEPDKLLPGKELPYFCDAAEFDLAATQAAEY